MAIVGSALMPKFQGMIIDIGDYNVDDVSILEISEMNFSFILPLLCFFYVAWYGSIVKKNI